MVALQAWLFEYKLSLANFDCHSTHAYMCITPYFCLAVIDNLDEVNTFEIFF